MIDILQSFGLSESIKRSEVSEPSLSYHRNILFNLEGFVPECLVRNSRGIKGGSEGQDGEGSENEHDR